MSRLVQVIASSHPAIRNSSLDSVCAGLSPAELLAEASALEAFRRESDNLYDRVRALFFLYALHRFHLCGRLANDRRSPVPFSGYVDLLNRRFEEAISIFLCVQARIGPGAAISSALGASYRALAFQTLADQVRKSVRSVRGNQWMFRTGHPSDYPLRIRPELNPRSGTAGTFAILREATPVRMDLSHSAWSDIFFLGMDFPEGARVLNISVDLCVRGRGDSTPKPPVEAYFRVIDESVIRLTSVDLGCTADVVSVAELFDFGRDYLGLLKAAVIASGLIPSGLEGSAEPLADVLGRLTGCPGRGIELVSKVNDIPKGSRLAVSTNLLACLITVCMRATGQIRSLTGTIEEDDRRIVAARAILGEWLGGSGGGWQDSGGVWPGIKLITGELAREGDPEFGISRGCLLPRHRILTIADVSGDTRERLQQSLVLVHGGMAQDVGPILEMVTERYLLRSDREWKARQNAIEILDRVMRLLERGDIRGIGASTQDNFDQPIQDIIPWAANLYTQELIDSVRAQEGDAFWGFWMLGGMSGGGMGFLFDPRRKPESQDRLGALMRKTKQHLEHAVPFAMDPVVYDFAIDERGTSATLRSADRALMPVEYYMVVAPPLLRTDARALAPSRRAELDLFADACAGSPEFAGAVHNLFERMLPQSVESTGGGAAKLDQLLDSYGFDKTEHETIQANLRAGRIGLAQNRLPPTTTIQDVTSTEIFDARAGMDDRYRRLGEEAIANGAVAAVSLAGGVGTRWTKGAGVVKALNPFVKLNGRHRTFIETHLAKSRRTGRRFGVQLPHVITTSYLTHDAIREWLAAECNYGYEGQIILSPGRSIGLRFVPMERDLRFAWEEMPHQILDDQAEKMRESLHSALIAWAKQSGEGSNYTDNLPMQCLHPVGHWYEIPNLLRNGVLASLLRARPQLRYLMVHNIDTVGADLDPGLLGYHISRDAAMTAEVILRYAEDRGGGLASVEGRMRLIEGLALSSDEIESSLSYYNTATMWIDIDKLLAVFDLTRADLDNIDTVSAAVRAVGVRMPTYITLKDVKKRWGKGQEDIFPVAQFEKLWGDMTALPELDCAFAVVTRMRGQQLKEPAQLDVWLRDGSAAYLDSLCDWT